MLATCSLQRLGAALTTTLGLGLSLAAPLPLSPFSTLAQAAESVRVGQPAPQFTLKNQDGQSVSLSDRKGKGWTVVYFYPKSGTPGCTKQACAFRDAIKVIHAKNAVVYGISADTVAEQKAFHAEHKLSFDLLADPQDVAIAAYDVKVPGGDVAKRWTFLVDPNLVVQAIDTNVDPALDAQKTAQRLDELQKKAAPQKS